MTRVLFVADQFSDANRGPRDKHPGGAELTDEAAIAACPWPITKLALALLGRAASSFLDAFDVIVVANSSRANARLLRRIADTGRHVLFEHDLRICRYRGNFPVARDPVHRMGQRCWCPHLEQRELFDRALGTIFLTQLQEQRYRGNPYFAARHTRVLGSSLFDAKLLEHPGRLHTGQRDGTCIFASPHAIKGHREALAYCRQRGINPVRIKNLKPPAVLELFAQSERFVYLPIGPEWAGRMVVEARLLGCETVVSELVGVAGEPFWNLGREQALAFLLDGPRRFWSFVEELLNTADARPVRATGLQEKAVDKLAWLLRAPPVRLWPAGPRHGNLPPPRAYPAW